jgi:hypothetical protein
MRRFCPLLWSDRLQAIQKHLLNLVIYYLSIYCTQILKKNKEKLKKQTHETHESHETHMVKLPIPLSFLILANQRKRNDEFPKTHERHETHGTHSQLLYSFSFHPWSP